MVVPTMQLNSQVKLVARTNAEGETTSYTYTARRQLETVTDAALLLLATSHRS